VTGGAVMDYHLALWHGFTPALGLSAIAVALGLGALVAYRRVRALWQAGPHPEAKAMFDAFIEGAAALARGITHGLHNGSLQRYLAFALTAFTLAGFAAFLAAPHAAGTRALLPAHPAAIAAWVLLVGGCALTVMLFRRRVLSVLVVGTVGLIVCLAFIYLSAPDLALTQISVEVATVILILLALYFLPKEGPQSSSVRADPLRHLRDGVLAIVAGIGMAGASWAMLTRDGSSLSSYYLDNSVSGGGGTNVVNVILVDFRGFDTFGEITVLGIAALAIYALLDGALFGRTGRRLGAWSPDRPQSADRHPMIMVVATRVMLPLAMLVGAYIFLRGHNQPGGGFIAALVVSIALIMQYMASGFGWAAHRVKVNYHAMIGLGVLVAAATGIGAMVLDQPFLTSTFGHFHLPLVGEFELASAMAFDTGVFLTVVGAVMLALANLSRMGRWTSPYTINTGAMDVDPRAASGKEQG
ncbi:MAG TPA: MnhB domain-containing protein, partial [Thauera aminoaromatica]|nr:MnhB domain-containing protein [Thauera aminoaromatica]